MRRGNLTDRGDIEQIRAYVKVWPSWTVTECSRLARDRQQWSMIV